MAFPVFRNDGPMLHDIYDFNEYMESLGINVEQLHDGLSRKYQEQYRWKQDEHDDWESLYDGLTNEFCNLIVEVCSVAEKLKSGKSGNGMTKYELGCELLRICKEYEDNNL